jgi:hypothetical protein
MKKIVFDEMYPIFGGDRYRFIIYDEDGLWKLKTF